MLYRTRQKHAQLNIPARWYSLKVALCALQITLYHQHVRDALAEDGLLELVDWCYRKLQYLNTEGYRQAKARGRHVVHCPTGSCPGEVACKLASDY
jgi:hypothetical protein